ncbi:CopL family metal-binding regulatory protein [Luteimonas sp. S4-F44]|uniref:CopL family metal-binding regulatory protein n=1 Tax=Luteimonas sp. S4-F44 TaxID=2925842 RepID=UPI001F53A349|nr:CopL family metal-binding regulatory protein [Luteimonas sp. S4-F44]UNK44036.1 CopL family metal-binding regulatory protein [Luteimonas sp. S4-F44]
MPRVSATAVRILLLALLLIESMGAVFAAPAMQDAASMHDAGQASDDAPRPCHGAADDAPSERNGAPAPHACDDEGGCLCLHGCSAVLIPRQRPLPEVPAPARHAAEVAQARGDPAAIQPIRPPIVIA